MKTGPDIAALAALMGDPARANMLIALMSGRALTAGELAVEAGVTAPTASGHLARLLEGGLLAVEAQGRHRYYRLAGPDVAMAVEALMGLAQQAGGRRVRTGPRDPELRLARVCYDHLAGERGVALFAGLARRKLIALDDGAVSLTASGEECMGALGIDVSGLRRGGRPLCRTCLDWSERRMHLAGGLGAALMRHALDQRWARIADGTRIVTFTAKGEAALAMLWE